MFGALVDILFTVFLVMCGGKREIEVEGRLYVQFKVGTERGYSREVYHSRPGIFG